MRLSRWMWLALAWLSSVADTRGCGCPDDCAQLAAAQDHGPWLRAALANRVRGGGEGEAPSEHILEDETPSMSRGRQRPAPPCKSVLTEEAIESSEILMPVGSDPAGSMETPQVPVSTTGHLGLGAESRGRTSGVSTARSGLRTSPPSGGKQHPLPSNAATAKRARCRTRSEDSASKRRSGSTKGKGGQRGRRAASAAALTARTAGNTTASGRGEALGLRCKHVEGCIGWAVFGTDKARYCKQHRMPGHTNAKSSKCITEGCQKLAVYGEPRVSVAGKFVSSLLFCSTHRREGDVDVKGKRCKFPHGCLDAAKYGLRSDGVIAFCPKHMIKGLHVYLASKRCEHSGCVKSPSFGLASDGMARTCSEHKSRDHVQVKKRLCQNPEGCTRPSVSTKEWRAANNLHANATSSSSAAPRLCRPHMAERARKVALNCVPGSGAEESELEEGEVPHVKPCRRMGSRDSDVIPYCKACHRRTRRCKHALMSAVLSVQQAAGTHTSAGQGRAS